MSILSAISAITTPFDILKVGLQRAILEVV